MHWMKIVTGSCPGEPGAESGAGKSPAAASRDAYHVTKEAAICAFTPTTRELSDFSFLRECLQALQGFFFWDLFQSIHARRKRGAGHGAAACGDRGIRAVCGQRVGHCFAASLRQRLVRPPAFLGNYRPTILTSPLCSGCMQ